MFPGTTLTGINNQTSCAMLNPLIYCVCSNKCPEHVAIYKSYNLGIVKNYTFETDFEQI